MDNKLLTIPELFAQAASANPQKVAFQIKDDQQWRKLTYQDVTHRAYDVAGFLVRSGCSKGDRVVILLENCPEWGCIYLGISYAGAVAVPLDTQLSPQEIKELSEEAEANVLFCSYSLFVEKRAEIKKNFRTIVVVGAPAGEDAQYRDYSTLQGQARNVVFPKVFASDSASLIYTSGTEGYPKGVILTHKNFCSNYWSISRQGMIQKFDIILSVLPLHHAYPFLVALLAPLFEGGTVTYVSSLKSDVILQALNEAQVTIFVVVPHLLSLFYKRMKESLFKRPAFVRFILNRLLTFLWTIRRLTGINVAKRLLGSVHRQMGQHMRFFACGGAKLESETQTFFSKLGFTIIEGYGLTESSPIIAMNPLARPKIGSVGKVVEGVRVTILDPDENGVGQIVACGDNIMQGYYQRKEATDQVLKDGWLYTGDLGRLDSQGYLWICGRVKEIIVLSSGKNISPQEIEAHYSKAPMIKEICVLPDESCESLAAVVVPDLEYYRRQEATNIDDTMHWTMQYLSEELPAYKRVRNFVLVNVELPRTRLGKLRRFQVAKLYKRQNAVQPYDREQGNLEEFSAVGEQIASLLKRETGCKNVWAQAHLDLDLGVDSLSRVELALTLEKTFGVKISEQTFVKIFTVAELVSYIEKLLPEGGIVSEGDQMRWAQVLAQEPSRFLQEQIAGKERVRYRLFTFVATIVFVALCKVFFLLRVKGKGNVRGKRLILCPNHTSFLDGFIVFAAVPFSLKRELFFVGLRAYFDNPVTRRVLPFLKVIPVDPSKNVVESMQASAFVLKKGKALCIFPEGSRSVDGKLKKFKRGVGVLSRELDATVIPVYISGAYEAWRPTRRWPRPHVIKVIFGSPYTPEQLAQRGMSLHEGVDQYQAVSAGLQDAVASLREETRCSRRC